MVDKINWKDNNKKAAELINRGSKYVESMVLYIKEKLEKTIFYR